MGRPKPLLAWRGVTLVEHQVACLLAGGCDEVVVVLGHAAEEVAPYVHGERVRAVVNPDYRQGKTTSIKAGLAHADPSADAILLLAVDQPRHGFYRPPRRGRPPARRCADNLAALPGDTAAIRSRSPPRCVRSLSASARTDRAYARCSRRTGARRWKRRWTTR